MYSTNLLTFSSPESYEIMQLTFAFSFMLDGNVDLHSAGMAMYFAKVSIVLQKHRAVRVLVFIALGGAVALGLVLSVDNAHFAIRASCVIALSCQGRGILH